MTAVKDRKSTRLNSSHTEIYTLSLHDALPIWALYGYAGARSFVEPAYARSNYWLNVLVLDADDSGERSEEHTSELQSHRDLHSFPTRRSSDLGVIRICRRAVFCGACVCAEQLLAERLSAGRG